MWDSTFIGRLIAYLSLNLKYSEWVNKKLIFFDSCLLFINQLHKGAK